jgi:hypothetical protein
MIEFAEALLIASKMLYFTVEVPWDSLSTKTLFYSGKQ